MLSRHVLEQTIGVVKMELSISLLPA